MRDFSMCVCLTVWLSDFTTKYLSDCMTVWLFDFLTFQRNVLLFYRLSKLSPWQELLHTVGLFGCLSLLLYDSLSFWLPHGLKVKLSEFLTVWLSDCLNVADWTIFLLADFLTVWLSDFPTVLLSDFLTVWLSDSLLPSFTPGWCCYLTVAIWETGGDWHSWQDWQNITGQRTGNWI